MKVKAFAKINLTLDIIGKRSDGYHLLDMIMQTVDLCDLLDIELNDSGKISVSSSDSVLGGENDITYKAAELFFETAGIKSGVTINIEKHIPVAAGLGGGSSDAAAVVKTLNRLFNNPLSMSKLEEICIKLGSDVPYFLYGGTVRVGGAGEKFEPLPNFPDCFIVIAKNGIKASTGEIYRKIDSYEHLSHPETEKAVSAIKAGDLYSAAAVIKNAFDVIWDNSELYGIFRKYGAVSHAVCGSGPSVFAVFDNQANAQKAIELLGDIEAYLTRPVFYN